MHWSIMQEQLQAKFTYSLCKKRLRDFHQSTVQDELYAIFTDPKFNILFLYPLCKTEFSISSLIYYAVQVISLSG